MTGHHSGKRRFTAGTSPAVSGWRHTPAFPMAAASVANDTSGNVITVAFSEAKFIEASCTPGTFKRAFSTRGDTGGTTHPCRLKGCGS